MHALGVDLLPLGAEAPPPAPPADLVESSCQGAVLLGFLRFVALRGAWLINYGAGSPLALSPTPAGRGGRLSACEAGSVLCPPRSFLQNDVAECLIGDELLEARVLFFQFLEPFELRLVHLGVLPSPAVIGLLAHLDLFGGLRDCGSLSSESSMVRSLSTIC